MGGASSVPSKKRHGFYSREEAILEKRLTGYVWERGTSGFV